MLHPCHHGAPRRPQSLRPASRLLDVHLPNAPQRWGRALIGCQCQVGVQQRAARHGEAGGGAQGGLGRWMAKRAKLQGLESNVQDSYNELFMSCKQFYP